MITFDGGLSLGDEAKRREDFPVGNDMKNGKWPSTSNEATGRQRSVSNFTAVHNRDFLLVR